VPEEPKNVVGVPVGIVNVKEEFAPTVVNDFGR
jgi:precorrin isomerase